MVRRKNIYVTRIMLVRKEEPVSALEEFYTTRELAQLLGITERAVQLRAKREGWLFVQKRGRGGGKRWGASSTPKETRELIASGLLRQQYATQEADSCAIAGTIYSATLGTGPAPVQHIDFTPAPSAAPLFPGASDRERAVATARLAFVREVERMSGVIGKEGAIRHLVDSSRLGNLPSILMEQISTATACKRGEHLTRRTLYRWMTDYAERGEAGLLPSQSKIIPVPAWFDNFLLHYQKPQHPSVALAYSYFCKELAARGEVNPPSIHAVRRLLAKMNAPEREAGRATGNALLKLRPYQRRNTSELWPGDVYTADGTTFDAEVLHPGNGQPFKPEVTAVLDVATRRCVGLSISLAESRFTVLDALRMACCFGGIPAMFYSDGGPGYVTQHKALMSEIITADDMSAQQKTAALASLADSFNKMVSASRRVLPESNELAVALRVIQLLTEFVRQRFPQHATALLEVLEPFADEVAAKLGSGHG